MFLIKKCFKKMSLFNTLSKVILLLFFTVLFFDNIRAQCTPPGDIPFELAEQDELLPVIFDINGSFLQHNLLLNLPLCPENAAGATGCTQVQFDAPSSPLSDFGLSSYQEYYLLVLP